MLNKSLIIICLISIWGTVIYRFYALNNFGLFLAIFLVAASYIITDKKDKRNWILEIGYWKSKIINWKFSKISNLKSQISNFFYIFIFLYFMFLCFYILFISATTKSIISPWQVVPWYFFIFYALITFILLIIVNIEKTIKQFNNLTIFLLLAPFFFLSFGVALIIYKINYGFDPFIHQSTINLINEKGLVNPKPLYYLGQYSLELIIHKITNIQLFWIDKLLVPLLALIYLPAVLYKILREKNENQKIILTTIVSLLILPFSFFIVTTPQNLAYLFLMLVILLCLSRPNFFLIYLLALAAFVIQPIAGIPALLFAFAVMILRTLRISKIKKYIYILIFIATVFTLPLLFYIFEKNNNYSEHSINSNSLSSFIPKIIIPYQENVILNFVYLYAFNLKFFIFILALVGFITAFRSKDPEKNNIYFLYLGASLALFLSYFLTTYLPFDFLIEYERSNYADRIFSIASFFLLPFIICTMHEIIYKIKQQNKFVKISFSVFGALLISASLYISYPRIDNYFNSRGYSTGENDIKSVHWINSNAPENYIVLANQQVSAAALNEFGFKKYYKVNGAAREDGLGHKEDIFYYPVPTGGPLYQYYLDMVYIEPSRETIEAAMNLAGVNTGYFVLNKYWWAFKKILDVAKLESNEYKEFGDGEVYVFKYVR